MSTNPLIDMFGDWPTYAAHILHTADLLGMSVSSLVELVNVPVELLAELPGHEESPALVAASPPPSKSVGCCSVHNLLSEPSLLLGGLNAFYIGRANPKQQLTVGPLANISKMKNKSQGERDRVCNEDLYRLIRVLEVQSGAAWDELKRLALLVRSGAHVKLLCWCAPLRCHGYAIALVVEGLAARRKVSEIIEELRSLLPDLQSTYF